MVALKPVAASEGLSVSRCGRARARRSPALDPASTVSSLLGQTGRPGRPNPTLPGRLGHTGRPRRRSPVISGPLVHHGPPGATRPDELGPARTDEPPEASPPDDLGSARAPRPPGGPTVPGPPPRRPFGPTTPGPPHRTAPRVQVVGARCHDGPVSRLSIDAPLVGRRAELDALAAALDEARDGRPGAVLLAGDAGAGKTR
ncbi:AAA family ATPase, partial [Aquipuribacter hungaricus]|uniref:AAA family ATPase n=1 Tax=Aquipuribacter hungaricus TaxID=545624 RepID=UPI003BEEC563